MPTLKNLVFITGGSRSGKSALAESIAAQSGQKVYYLATMQRWDGDPEGHARIEEHRSRRPKDWLTLEVGSLLHETILGLPRQPALLIIDCLSMYVSNLLLYELKEGEDPYKRQQAVMDAVIKLIAAIAKLQEIQFVVVTNEVGWGIVPRSPIGRAYRDILGLANQSFARQAKTVYLSCSGLKLKLK